MAHLKFGPDKTVRQKEKMPQNGYFALEREELNWQRCREQFAKTYTEDIEGFFFSHNSSQREDIAHFILKFEEIVEESSCIKIKHSSFSRCNLNFALWVEPSPFWRGCEMKRSLFTILLRCALSYNKKEDNFEEALYSNKYIVRTKDATHRFLFGFTEYHSKGEAISGIGKGWVALFEKCDLSNIKNYLVHPLGDKRDECLAGAGSIWT